MKTRIEKKKGSFDLSDIATVLNTSASAGIAIAKFTKKDENIAGMIAGGLGLLAGGFFLAIAQSNDR